MPVISKIEAKTLRGRLLHAMIFFVLTLGGITMVYPFIIMVSGSLRSEMDEVDLDVLPQFMVDRDVLHRKFLETKYNQSVTLLNQQLLQQNFSMRTAEVPSGVNAAEVALFSEWLATGNLPRHWTALGGTFGLRTTPENLRSLRMRLAEKFNGDLDAYGHAMGSPIQSWSLIVFHAPAWSNQRYHLRENVLSETYFELQSGAPPGELHLESLGGWFLTTMIYPVYGQMNTAAYNAAHKDALETFSDFRLPRTVPQDDPVLRKEWIEFVQMELNTPFIGIHNPDRGSWEEFLRERYGNVEELSRVYPASFVSFADVPMPQGEWADGVVREDFRDYLNTLNPEDLILTGPEFSWRDFLVETFGGLQEINSNLGTSYGSLEEIIPPMAQLEAEHVAQNSTSLRIAYALRNYVNVLDELFLRGRAFVNTVIYCALAVFSALLVNPMAAYAMSRMKLPGTYKLLMILMATIAFPPMVTTIPQFILLREANLLNTFVALLLPSIVNGYLVFLLKGFFDSLPTELYEAATIDGASEIRIFFQITMSLSKPILAVVALGAFNGAYGAFLYPLIVAPSQDMWVLNVWLYQWQQTASTSAMFASVLIASIPTLLVFLVAQNIIMRGIVVPTEK